MVAITVVLGSVIGAFALDFGNQVEDPAPQVQVAFEFNETAGTADCGTPSGSGEGALTITHRGGDELPTAQAEVVGSDVFGGNVALDDGCTSLPAEMTAGTSFSTAVEADDEVRVLWANDDRSAVLGTWTDERE